MKNLDLKRLSSKLVKTFLLALVASQIVACGNSNESRGVGRTYGDGKSTVSTSSIGNMKRSGFLYNQSLSDYAPLLNKLFDLDTGAEPIGKVSTTPNPQSYSVQNGAFFWINLPNTLNNLKSGSLSQFDFEMQVFDDYAIKNNQPVKLRMNPSKGASAQIEINGSQVIISFSDKYGTVEFNGTVENNGYYSGVINFQSLNSSVSSSIEYFYINPCYLSSACSK